jgi:hypothetical protein
LLHGAANWGANHFSRLVGSDLGLSQNAAISFIFSCGALPVFPIRSVEFSIFPANWAKNNEKTQEKHPVLHSGRILPRVFTLPV